MNMKMNMDWNALGRSTKYTAPMALLLVMAYFGAALYRDIGAKDLRSEDIYYAWLEGKRIAEGQNPYHRVLQSDMRTNYDYQPTYLPGFYLIAGAAYRLGVADFGDWLKLWIPVCVLFHLLIASLLMAVLSRGSNWLVGCIAAVFWFFNRWSLAVLGIAHLDILALFFLLLSLHLFKGRKIASFLTLGLSLSIKHLAVFLLPLYLIWEFRDSRSQDRVRNCAKALAWMLVIPCAVSLPFFLWEPEGFMRAMALSATRLAGAHEGFADAFAPSIMQWDGLAARTPMFLIMAAVWFAAYKGYLRRYGACLLVMITFIDFNIVLYRQYMVWAVPLLPLAAFEWLGLKTETPEPRSGG